MNKMPIVFAIVAGLSLIRDARAQLINLEPAQPQAFREIRVQMPTSAFGLDLDGRCDRYDPADTQVTMAGNVITISVLMRGASDFSTCIPTPPLDQTIGALPAGTYELHVEKRATGRGSAGAIPEVIAFAVRPRAVAEPVADYTDLWWVPAESGWGVGIFHHPSHKVFVTLFVYGADGKPTWYVIPDGAFADAATYSGAIYKTTGPYFGATFDPAQFHIAPAGTGTITFDTFNLDRAVINFTIDGVNFRKSIQRQSF